MNPFFQVDPSAEVRTRKALQAIGDCLNGLCLGDILVRQTPGSNPSWGIAGLLYNGSGAPAGSLAFPGAYYLDTTAGKLYKKTGLTAWTLVYTFGAGSATIGASAHKTTAQSIPDNAFTALSLPTLIRDDGSFWSSMADTKFTITTAGWYTVGATVLWAANSSGQRRLALEVNGTTTIAYTTVISGAAGNDPSQNVCTPWYFAANDYVEAWAFQNGIGSALNTQNAVMSIMS